MKNPIKPNILPWFTMGAGGLGLALQVWLTSGIDKKGLLPAAHPASTLVFILSALVLAVLFLASRTLAPISKYHRLYPAGLGRALGNLFAAAGCLYGGIYYLKSAAGLGILTFIVGIAAAASLGYVAFLRLKGRRPQMVLHTIATVFFMLFTVCSCRSWSTASQILSYIFPLFSCVFLMLTSYHTTALDVRKGGRQWLVFFSQASLFFCCLSLTGKTRFFFLMMILYLALDLCSVSQKRQPEEA